MIRRKPRKTVRTPGIACGACGVIGLYIGRGEPEEPLCLRCYEEAEALGPITDETRFRIVP